MTNEYSTGGSPGNWMGSNRIFWGLGGGGIIMHRLTASYDTT